MEQRHYECLLCHKYFDSDKTTELTDLTIQKTSISSGDTTVSLKVDATTKNTYTMTVPAKTELASNGDVTTLTNGIVVSEGTYSDVITFVASVENAE